MSEGVHWDGKEGHVEASVNVFLQFVYVGRDKGDIRLDDKYTKSERVGEVKEH